MDDEVSFRRVEVRRRKIDQSDVPDSLLALIPFAERFGALGYLQMESTFRRSSQHDRDELKTVLELHREELIDWLEESVRRGSPYPAGHAAFSTLRMLADMM